MAWGARLLPFPFGLLVSYGRPFQIFKLLFYAPLYFLVVDFAQTSSLKILV